jgi:DNA-binding NarL/FixJ family response regulator
MKNKSVIQHMICILGKDTPDTVEIRRIVLTQPNTYRAARYPTLTDLESGLSLSIDACIAAILDLDSVPLDNRTIRQLTTSFPSVQFLSASRDRSHPDLRDAIAHHLFACLTKPIDPDELHYFLKCIRDDLKGKADGA